MNVSVFGLLRGDEGKGKIVDYFSNKGFITIRYAGGPNAGHTIYRGDKKIVLHQIPSGILNGNMCVIGRGCVVDLKKLVNEMLEVQYLIDADMLDSSKFKHGIKYNHDVFCKLNQNDLRDIRNYLKLSYGSHLITPEAIEEDIEREDSGKGNGSTKCGIAPTYRNKYYRNGIRVYDLFQKTLTDILEITGLSKEEFQYLQPIFADEELLINQVWNNSPEFDFLFEGAQGTLLDIDSPYYPNVSSSSPGIAGIISGTGINANKLMKNFNSIGVAKVYMSSVGVGKFITEIEDDDKNCKLIRDAGKEYGATTGRPRKVGWLDLPLLKYSIRTSGIKELCITRFDTLAEAMKDTKEFKVCRYYKNELDHHLEEYANIWNLDFYTPVYETFKIWEKCSMDDENFKTFIEFLQKELNIFDCTLKYLSVGKNKEDIIIL